MTAAAIFCVMLTGFYTIYTLIVYPAFVCSIRKLPGPICSSWWSGNMGDMLRDDDPSVTHCRWTDKFGPVIKFRTLFGKSRLHVADLTAIRHLLLSKSYSYSRPPLMQFLFENLLGKDGLVTATGEAHKRYRRVLAPAFAQARVAECFPALAMHAERLCSRLSSMAASTQVVDMGRMLNALTLDSIGSQFDYDFNAIDNLGNEVSDAADETLSGKMDLWTYAALHVLPYFPWLLRLPFVSVQQQQRPLKKLQAAAQKIMDCSGHSKHSQDDQPTLQLLPSLRKNANDVSKPHINDREMLGQITNLLAAGSETTATSLKWATVHLVRNPQVQARLREEIQQTLSLYDGELTEAVIAGMKYLDAFMMECLRYSPPVRSLLRFADADDVIPLSQSVKLSDGSMIDSVSVTRGQEISISIAAVNMDERLFPNAHAFEPSRWLDNNAQLAKQADSRGASIMPPLLTFSGGQRACIGYRFAALQEKIVLIKLLSNFSFDHATPDAKYALQENLTTKPVLVGNESAGLLIKVTSLDQSRHRSDGQIHH